MGLFICQLLSVIFGALALHNAKKSRIALGTECTEARNGRIFGMIGLIIGSIQIGLIVLGVIVLIVALIIGLAAF